MTHSLTDEMCEVIAIGDAVYLYDDMLYDDMRAAYDMGREKGHDEMLNEVISWIKANSWAFVEAISFTEDHEFNHSKFAAYLRKAMHPFPQEDQ